jgi:hypothetical protein
MASRRLEVVIAGNANDAVSALGQTERAVGRFDRTSGRAASGFSSAWRSGIGQVGRAVGGLVAGAGLAMFFSSAVAEAEDARAVMRQTEAVIESTGAVAGITAGHLEGLAGRLSDLAGVDDEVIQSAGNVMLTFKNIKAEGGIFDDALASALDMSRALDIDLQSATMNVSKALNNPIEGLGKLTRAGVDFTDQQKDQIAAMVYFGDTAGAQRIILQELEDQFGGASEANKKSSEAMTVAMDNIKESVGNILLPAMDAASGALTGMSDWFTGLPEPAQTAVIAIGSVAAAAIVMWATIGGPATLAVLSIGLVVGALWWLGDEFFGLGDKIGQFFDSMPQRWKQFQKDVEPAKQALDDATTSVKHFIKTFDWQAIKDAFADLGDSIEEFKTQLGITSSNGQVAMMVLGVAIWFVAISIQTTIGAAGALLKALARVGQASLAGISFWVGFLKGLLGAASTAASKVIEWMRKLSSVKVSVPGLGDIGTLLSRAADAAQRLWDKLTSVASRISSMPSLPSINLPFFAAGTTSAPPGMAWVGERGPELVRFSGGERVYNANQSRTMAGGTVRAGGASIVVNVYGTATAADGQAVVDALKRWSRSNGPVPVKVSA